MYTLTHIKLPQRHSYFISASSTIIIITFMPILYIYIYISVYITLGLISGNCFIIKMFSPQFGGTSCTLFYNTMKSYFLLPQSLSVLQLQTTSKLSENYIPIWCNTLLEDIHICLKVAFQNVELMLNWITELQSYWLYYFWVWIRFVRVLYELIGPWFLCFFTLVSGSAS